MADRKQGPFDVFTPSHVFVGVLTRWAGIGPLAAFGLWVTFEFLENTIAENDRVKEAIPASGAEGGRNILGDLIANSFGYLAMDWWLWKNGSQSPFFKGPRKLRP